MPIVVTNACADNCAREFGFGGCDQAQAWLATLIRDHGKITNRLPTPVERRRSPSGYFLLVDDVLILPLAADREGRAQWIATNCVLFPDYRRRHGAARDVDPFVLDGTALLSQVNITAHAVERFQQRCQANPNPQVAEAELLHILATDVRAVPRPPEWCRTAKADFYLVAHNEFCLPVSRQGSGGKAFDALTCMHRASDLLLLDGPSLARVCFIDPRTFADDERRNVIATAFEHGASLSWHRPAWVKPDGRARFWVVFSDRLVAPVAWEPDRPGRLLVILGLAERRTLIQRVVRWIRSRRGPA